MEKIPKPPQESNYSSQTNDTNKIDPIYPYCSCLPLKK